MEMATYQAIVAAGGKFNSGQEVSNKSECPCKEEVESKFSNVTVGGGVQSHELVWIEALTFRNDPWNLHNEDILDKKQNSHWDEEDYWFEEDWETQPDSDEVLLKAKNDKASLDIFLTDWNDDIDNIKYEIRFKLGTLALNSNPDLISAFELGDEDRATVRVRTDNSTGVRFEVFIDIDTETTETDSELFNYDDIFTMTIDRTHFSVKNTTGKTFDVSLPGSGYSNLQMYFPINSELRQVDVTVEFKN